VVEIVRMYVDTREPEDIRLLARRLGFVQMKLDYGDYASDTIIFERKKMGDLVNSVFARYFSESRLFKQMEKLYSYCARHKKVACLVVFGKKETIVKEFAKRGQRLNMLAIYGALGSVVCRYDCNIIWVDTKVEDMLNIMRKVAEKVEEGKMLIPRRRNLKQFSKVRSVAIVARALDISPRLASLMVNRVGGLYDIVYALKNQPAKILVLEGVGKKTFQRMRDIAGIR